MCVCVCVCVCTCVYVCSEVLNAVSSSFSRRFRAVVVMGRLYVRSEEIQKPCLRVGALCGRLRGERRLRLCPLERCRYVTLISYQVLKIK